MIDEFRSLVAGHETGMGDQDLRAGHLDCLVNCAHCGVDKFAEVRPVRAFTSFAVGFDGQGFRYNQNDRRFNQRQRGFYEVATKELGVPGLELHPSFNISDFDSNGIFGSLPLTINIRDKASILLEWDNINNWSDSRLNAGLRVYLTPSFNVDFAVRAMGAGGFYGDGGPRGPERVVQLKYRNTF